MARVTGSPAYYRDRAICRKIAREGTGLAVDRMTTKQLHDAIAAHSTLIRQRVEELDGADVRLARAAAELDDICSELIIRGVQLTLPI